MANAIARKLPASIKPQTIKKIYVVHCLFIAENTVLNQTESDDNIPMMC